MNRKAIHILSFFFLLILRSYAQVDSLRASIQRFMPGVNLQKNMMDIREDILVDTSFTVSDTDRCKFFAEYHRYDIIPGTFDQYIFFETQDDSDWVCHPESIYVTMNFYSREEAVKCRDSLCRIFEKYYSWHKRKPEKHPMLGYEEDYLFAADKKSPVVAELSLSGPFDMFPYWGIGITWMKKE